MLSTIRLGCQGPSRAAVAQVIDLATRGAAAGLLLLAASQKCLEAFSTVLLPGQSGWRRSTSLALAGFEAYWALWMLSGVRPRFTRWASASLFAAFAVISAYHGVLGHGSCGCFGNMQVNPWLTCAVDVGLAAAFVLNRHNPTRARSSPQREFERVAIILVIYIAVLIPAALLMRSRSIATATGANSGSTGLVLLEPDTWKRKRFPLVERIDIGASLMKGQWKLLFYRPGCPICADAIKRISEAAQRGNAAPSVPWAFIELPPVQASQPPAPTELPPNGIHGRLDPNFTWIADVPFVVLLVDGNVS